MSIARGKITSHIRMNREGCPEYVDIYDESGRCYRLVCVLGVGHVSKHKTYANSGDDRVQLVWPLDGHEHDAYLRNIVGNPNV